MGKVECPSGLAGVTRKLKVREIRTIIEKADQGSSMTEMLKAVWKTTLDYGPYKEPLDWNLVLLGDRLYTLASIAIDTYGPGFDFSVPCRHCGTLIDWSVSLDELDVYDLSDESREIIANGGNRFSTKTKDGQDVVFRLLTGHDEAKLSRIQESSPERMIEASLCAKIREVDGVEPAMIQEWVRNLDLDLLDDLVERIDEADCGVETGIGIRCGSMSCRAEQEIEIPFGTDLILRIGRKSASRRKKQSRRSVRKMRSQ
jgi:hypothetical protein